MNINTHFFIISQSILLRMKNISDESFKETGITHFMFNNFFENRAFYEIRRKNIVERGRPHMTIWRMRIECWIPKATNTHTHTHTNTGCVILITFPLQQRLPETAVVLLYTYIFCLVNKLTIPANRFIVRKLQKV